MSNKSILEALAEVQRLANEKKRKMNEQAWINSINEDGADPTGFRRDMERRNTPEFRADTPAADFETNLYRANRDEAEDRKGNPLLRSYDDTRRYGSGNSLTAASDPQDDPSEIDRVAGEVNRTFDGRRRGVPYSLDYTPPRSPFSVNPPGNDNPSASDDETDYGASDDELRRTGGSQQAAPQTGGSDRSAGDESAGLDTRPRGNSGGSDRSASDETDYGPSDAELRRTGGSQQAAPQASQRSGSDIGSPLGGGARDARVAKPFEFSDAAKTGKGVVTADELKRFRDHVGNQNATLGQFLNAARGKTAIAGGANDPSVIQKNKLDPKYAEYLGKNLGKPLPDNSKNDFQAYRPDTGTVTPKRNTQSAPAAPAAPAARPNSATPPASQPAGQNAGRNTGSAPATPPAGAPATPPAPAATAGRGVPTRTVRTVPVAPPEGGFGAPNTFTPNRRNGSTQQDESVNPLIAAFIDLNNKNSDNIFEAAKKLKGNQYKLDKNHNGKLDSQDFKMLRGNKVEEGKMADKDYDGDGKIESAKDEVWGSRLKAAKKAGKLKEDYEYGMARNELATAGRAIQRLMVQLKGEGELEAWVQSKITKASDYLDSVADYMESGRVNEQANIKEEDDRDTIAGVVDRKTGKNVVAPGNPTPPNYPGIDRSPPKSVPLPPTRPAPSIGSEEEELAPFRKSEPKAVKEAYLNMLKGKRQ